MNQACMTCHYYFTIEVDKEKKKFFSSIVDIEKAKRFCLLDAYKGVISQ